MVRATIQDIRWSLISHDVRFVKQDNFKEVLNLRKKHYKLTQLIWITLQPVINSGYFLYNPRAMIVLILN